MIGFPYDFLRRPLLLATAVALTLGSVALPSEANAWWRGGVVVGVVPPPVYFGPPVFYPPPVVYAPPGAPGTTCYAGRYICPLPQPFAPGSTCSCPDNFGRRAYGQAR